VLCVGEFFVGLGSACLLCVGQIFGGLVSEFFLCVSRFGVELGE